MKARLALYALSGWLLGSCATISEQTRPAAEPVALQILAMNDFHGALEPLSAPTRFRDGDMDRAETLGGAVALGATLQQLREGQTHTVTIAAGDLIGASPLASSLFLDEPAINVLGQVGLDIASVGNHEFDLGIDELLRKQNGGCARFSQREPCAREQFAGARFRYLAGNTVDDEGDSLFPGTTLRTFGTLKVGFIGLTLKDTPNLVTPSAVAGYTFLDEASTANTLAAHLKGEGADLIVLIIHEGGQVEPRFNLAGCPGLSGAIVPIIDQLSSDIRIVASGHTHHAYACMHDSADGTPRLLTSAGASGTFVTDIRLSFHPETKALMAMRAANMPVRASQDGEKSISDYVAGYVAAVAPIAGRVVGQYALAPDPPDAAACQDTPAQRLIADAHAAAAAPETAGGAQFAFTNTGGVRSALPQAAAGALTFGDISQMQPFGNFLLTVELTGRQIREALEGQFCGEERAMVCRSLLIPSSGFAYAFDRERPAGMRVTSMKLNGAPVQPDTTYTVALNNFLADGGDGFTPLARGKRIGEAGGDLDILEAYLTGGAQISGCGRVREISQTR